MLLLGQQTVAVVLSSSDQELFLVQESSQWPLPRHHAKLPLLDSLPPQFTILQQRKINEVHYLVRHYLNDHINRVVFI